MDFKKWFLRCLLIFGGFAAVSLCQSCEGFGEPRVGCVSGVLPGTNNRVYILCISSDEYARSGNTFGSFSYDNIIWTEVDDCTVCPSLDYDDL